MEIDIILNIFRILLGKVAEWLMAADCKSVA